MRRRIAGSKGQATVEMALVLPILLWLLVGLVDVARMANAFLTVQHAAREAVRVGATGATDAEVEQRARDSMVTLESDRITVQITPAGYRASGSDLTVSVTYRYKVMVMFNLAGSDVTLQGRLTGRVE